MNKGAIENIMNLYQTGIISLEHTLEDILIVINNDPPKSSEEKHAENLKKINFIQEKIQEYQKFYVNFEEMEKQIINILISPFKMRFFIDLRKESEWVESLSPDHKAQYIQYKVQLYLQDLEIRKKDDAQK